jgi:hypothetical protein
MPRTSIRLLATVLMLTAAAPASADWLVVPFIGTAFSGETSLPILQRGAIRAQTVFGASGLWLPSGVFGVEGDFAYGPSFFQANELIESSSVSTIGGGLVVTFPLGVTRESLRPYAVAGIDMMHARIEDAVNVLTQEETLAGMHFGGGAIGFLTPKAGLRFDVRHFQSLSREPAPLNFERRSKLSFWRLTFGVVIRVG